MKISSFLNFVCFLIAIPLPLIGISTPRETPKNEVLLPIFGDGGKQSLVLFLGTTADAGKLLGDERRGII